MGSLCFSRHIWEIPCVCWATPFPAPSAEDQGEKPRRPLDQRLPLLPSFDLRGHVQAPSDLSLSAAEVLCTWF